ncbi:hypothetical protein [Caldilinea sp.]|uniref:hypothetical protein n=1 Tax=Caldilinea sp. TaxID=2293560 RepID=UPI0021DE03EF|nr:hypothetical protein [Caldilinea sp.]GIV73536.1 MAG: hypothetical protein KatS3mg049_2092 [Caldilinea sp.]
MDLQEWRRRQQQGEKAELPSGLVVRLRRVGVLDLAQRGQIPATLKPQLDEYIRMEGAVANLDQFVQMTELIDLVCGACIVEPRELDVGELPMNDRLAIFTWANEGATTLRPFRGAEAESVGAG